MHVRYLLNGQIDPRLRLEMLRLAHQAPKVDFTVRCRINRSTVHQTEWYLRLTYYSYSWLYTLNIVHSGTKKNRFAKQSDVALREDSCCTL